MNIFVSKETRLNIRVKPNFKADLEAVAEFHGLTVSSYVHSVLVRKIREEKENAPDAFQSKPMITVEDRGALAYQESVEARMQLPISSESAGTNDYKNKKK